MLLSCSLIATRAKVCICTGLPLFTAATRYLCWWKASVVLGEEANKKQKRNRRATVSWRRKKVRSLAWSIWRRDQNIIIIHHMYLCKNFCTLYPRAIAPLSVITACTLGLMAVFEVLLFLLSFADAPSTIDLGSVVSIVAFSSMSPLTANGWSCYNLIRHQTITYLWLQSDAHNSQALLECVEWQNYIVWHFVELSSQDLCAQVVLLDVHYYHFSELRKVLLVRQYVVDLRIFCEARDYLNLLLLSLVHLFVQDLLSQSVDEFLLLAVVAVSLVAKWHYLVFQVRFVRRSFTAHLCWVTDSVGWLLKSRPSILVIREGADLTWLHGGVRIALV